MPSELTLTYYSSIVTGVDMNPVARVRVTLQPWCYGPRPLVFSVSWPFLWYFLFNEPGRNINGGTSRK